MNILCRVTWKAMWKNRTRTIVTIIGIILSAAMFTAVTTMAVSAWTFLFRGYRYSDGDYYVNFSFSTGEQMAALRQNPSVNGIADYQALGYVHLEDKDSQWSTFTLAAVDDAFLDTMPVHLLEGRLPETSGEILLPETAVEAFSYFGIPCEVGNAVTLDVGTVYSKQLFSELEIPERSFTGTYTVVGIMEDHRYGDDDLPLYSLLTKADGSQEPAMWHRAFVKTQPASAAHSLSQEYGLRHSTNSRMLELHGGSRAVNYNSFIQGIAIALCAVIMIGSISLIYNAFSISVTERTREFGLLSSVGATRRQLRSSVLLEATVLSLIGIPLGLIFGWAGIAVTISLLGKYIAPLFSFSAGGAVQMTAVLSPLALLAAALIALVTVYLSAWIPSRRATRVAPLEAIRQAQDYHVGKKDIQVGKLTGKLWGLSGTLAKKYYKVSRRKYRATVLALTLSVILFLSAVSIGDVAKHSIDRMVNTENFDISIYSADQKTMEQIRMLPGVKQSAYNVRLMCDAGITEDMYDEAYLAYINEFIGSENVHYCMISYLEDAAFRQFLNQQGIDSEPYFDPEHPLALVCDQVFTQGFYVQNEQGEWVRNSYDLTVFQEDVRSIPLLPSTLPEELRRTGNWGWNWEQALTGDGAAILEVFEYSDARNETGITDPDSFFAHTNSKYYLASRAGSTFTYYEYDPDTKTAGSVPLATHTDTAIPQFQLGEQIRTVPYGLTRYDTTNNPSCPSFVLPLSMAPESCMEDLKLSISVSNYPEVRAYLEALGDDVGYVDYLADEQNMRGLLIFVNALSYGFIILISLIAAANVFNSISTNIALRRRDFGMLRSIGMKGTQLRRMLVYECLIYGSRALIWGLPISLMIHFGIFRIGENIASTTYAPPYGALAVAIASVFLVVLLSMLYALAKLRKESPMEAIRMGSH